MKYLLKIHHFNLGYNLNFIFKARNVGEDLSSPPRSLPRIQMKFETESTEQ